MLSPQVQEPELTTFEPRAPWLRPKGVAETGRGDNDNVPVRRMGLILQALTQGWGEVSVSKQGTKGTIRAE